MEVVCYLGRRRAVDRKTGSVTMKLFNVIFNRLSVIIILEYFEVFSTNIIMSPEHFEVF